MPGPAVCPATGTDSRSARCVTRFAPALDAASSDSGDSGACVALPTGGAPSTAQCRCADGFDQAPGCLPAEQPFAGIALSLVASIRAGLLFGPNITVRNPAQLGETTLPLVLVEPDFNYTFELVSVVVEQGIGFESCTDQYWCSSTSYPSARAPSYPDPSAPAGSGSLNFAPFIGDSLLPLDYSSLELQYTDGDGVVYCLPPAPPMALVRSAFANPFAAPYVSERFIVRTGPTGTRTVALPASLGQSLKGNPFVPTDITQALQPAPACAIAATTAICHRDECDASILDSLADPEDAVWILSLPGTTESCATEIVATEGVTGERLTTMSVRIEPVLCFEPTDGDVRSSTCNSTGHGRCGDPSAGEPLCVCDFGYVRDEATGAECAVEVSCSGNQVLSAELECLNCVVAAVPGPTGRACVPAMCPEGCSCDYDNDGLASLGAKLTLTCSAAALLGTAAFPSMTELVHLTPADQNASASVFAQLLVPTVLEDRLLNNRSAAGFAPRDLRPETVTFFVPPNVSANWAELRANPAISVAVCEGAPSSTACAVCPKGTFAAVDGSGCVACPRGQWYGERSGAAGTSPDEGCASCPDGTFTDIVGATTAACGKCPDNTVTSDPAGHRACKCRDGYYRVHRFRECILCDEGVTCVNDTRILEPGNFWEYEDAASWAAYLGWTTDLRKGAGWEVESLDLPGVSLASVCDNEDACAGGLFRDPCDEGFTGAMCTECEEGYRAWYDDCLDCPGKAAAWISLIVVIIVLLVIARYIARANTAHAYKIGTADAVESLDSKLTKVNIGIANLQVLSAISTYGGSWPANFESFISFFSVLGVSPLYLLGPSCVDTGFEIDVYNSYLTGVLLPIVALSAMALWYQLSKVLGRRPDKVAFTRNAFNLAGILYPGIALQTCRMLQDCDERCLYVGQPDCPSYLVSSPGTQCDTDRYDDYVGVAWATFVLIVLGYPLLLFTLMFYHRAGIQRVMTATEKHVAAEPQDLTVTVRSVSFYFESFRPDFFYWQVIEVLKILTFTGLILFIPSGSYAQLTFSAFFAAMCLWVLEKYRPYNSEGDHVFEQLGQWVTLSALLLAMAVQGIDGDDNRTDEEKEDDKDVVGWFLITFVCLFLLRFLWFLFYAFCHRHVDAASDILVRKLSSSSYDRPESAPEGEGGAAPGEYLEVGGAPTSSEVLADSVPERSRSYMNATFA